MTATMTLRVPADPVTYQAGDVKTAGDWRWEKLGANGPDEETWGKVHFFLTFLFLKDGRRFLPWLRGVVGDRAGGHLQVVLTRAWATLGSFIQGRRETGTVMDLADPDRRPEVCGLDKERVAQRGGRTTNRQVGSMSGM